MYIVNAPRNDGFGAQYQTIIFSILYAELNGLPFAYRPFTLMEHNYDNDPLFVEKKENLINIKGNYPSHENIPYDEIKRVDLSTIYNLVESNIDSVLNSESFSKIKNLFKEGKTKKEEGKVVSLHVRRPNRYDIGDYGYTQDEYFMRVISEIKNKHNDIEKIKLYSQGKPEMFEKFSEFNVELHLNESIEETFTDLVFSDILVMSKGSFSYCAGLLSEGTVYYLPFWHKPKSTWLTI